MDASDEADRERLASRARDTQLVHAIRAGDSQAFGQLYDKWFDRVYDLASRIVRNHDIAAEVAQDTFLKAWRSLDNLENPDAFGGWLLRIARNAAYNRSEREGRATAFDDQGLAMIESVGASPAGAPAGFNVEDRLGRASSPETALEDREAQSLVWQAAAALPTRDVEVLDLQLRHGLSPAEIGDVIGMNRNAANQLVHRLRGRLETAIRARVLWRDGQPSCAVLAARLREAGIDAFSAEAVRVVERHVPGCAECDEKQRLRLQPAALFAAAPLLIAPQLIKQQAASALEAAGVPMQGSAFSSTAVAGAGAGAGGSGASGGSTGSGAGGSGGAGAGSAAGFGALAAVPGGATGVAAKSSRRGLRNGLLAAAAVVIVILGVIGVSARVGDGSAPIEVASSGTAPRRGTTSSTANGSSTSAAPSSTSTGLSPTTSAVVPTTSVNPTPPPSDQPTAPTTRPTPTTTAPATTTTLLAVDATITMTPPSRDSRPWPMTAIRSISPPTLSWSVTTKGKVTLSVVGPAPGNATKMLSTDLTGSTPVCPGQLDASGQVCSTPPGTYTYTLTVFGSDGRAVTTKTATLTVTPYIG